MSSPTASHYNQENLPELHRLLPKPSPNFYFDDLGTVLHYQVPKEGSVPPNFHNVAEHYWICVDFDFSVIAAESLENAGTGTGEGMDVERKASDDHKIEDNQQSSKDDEADETTDKTKHETEEEPAVADNKIEDSNDTLTKLTLKDGSKTGFVTAKELLRSDCSPSTTEHIETDQVTEIPHRPRVNSTADGPITAVGITKIFWCVGLYLEVSATHYFCWHIYGAPAGYSLSSAADTYDTLPYKLIRRTYRDQLQKMLGNCTPRMRETLILCYWFLKFGSGGIIDGALEWAGLLDAEMDAKLQEEEKNCNASVDNSDKENLKPDENTTSHAQAHHDRAEIVIEARIQHTTRARGFIVRRPGQGIGQNNVVFLNEPRKVAEVEGWVGVDVWMGRRHGCLGYVEGDTPADQAKRVLAGDQAGAMMKAEEEEGSETKSEAITEQ